ncbi:MULTISPECIES: hypothetical protein [unclassified Streptomyces]|uniref:hypothetical protein n=1 Tax=unclassified Streptomyces TaxID=2593676 RepID=UPI00135BF2E8|nr:MULTISPECIES: hypothetical protein [unclassified Streptomyces]MDH6450327.1 hypothetical protein [Streptomyces sp. SAI-119]MDH6499130.1 hypothetical protein [Streptomyces sp. SAI-149]QUC62114.1 hypothetical protein IOD14_38075 [Streptomyces sp. A2-16]
MPPDLLARLTDRSRRGERQIKHVVDGGLRSAVGLQGRKSTRRALAPACAFASPL